MTRFFAALIIAFSLTALATAQTPNGASITVGAFSTTNNLNQITRDNIGLSLAGQFCFRGACAGGEGVGNDGRAARSRYWVSYDAISFKKFAFSGGGGFYRFGTTNGGFGQAGLGYGRFNAWGRYGNKNFTEADGQFAVVSLQNLAVAPFYRYTRHDDDLGARQIIHSAGLRLTFK